MPDYNFENLHDKEFEELANDIISKVKGVKVERFKSGKDGGVDGRFFTDSNNEIIIQSKHYLKSGYKKLLNHCKKIEADKVKKLNPSGYIFVCSESLSRKQKSEISAVFSPYLNEKDVFGKKDLNDYLKVFPEIERNHYKLWLTSTNTLQILLNQSIYLDSEWGLEKIKKSNKYYAKTKSHDEAKELLEKTHSLIISGEPGVGKTTLAEQLCFEYIAAGYDLVVIEEDIKDAKSVFNKLRKQIFYFDDFLGSNYLEGIENKEDSKVMKFIEAVKNDENKRFILTSRTSILNQGKYVSAIFKNKKLDKREYVLDVTDLENIDKARILYNHIYHSLLNESYIDQLYFDKRYLQIIKHKNFNPRLVEFITDEQRFSAIGAENYWNHAEVSLSNPKDIWEHVFNIQLEEYERVLIFIIVYYGSKISENKLQKTARDYFENKSIYITNIKFKKAIETLSGSLINRIIGGETVDFELFNPSIKDYVISLCENDAILIADLLYYLNSIKAFKTYQSSRIDFNDIFARIFSKSSSPEQLVTIKLLEKIHKNKSFSSHFDLFVIGFQSSYNHEISEDIKNLYLCELINSIKNNGIKKEVEYETISLLSYFVELEVLNSESLNWLSVIRDAVINYHSHEALTEITRLIEVIRKWEDLNFDEIISLIQEHIWAYCSESIHVLVSESAYDLDTLDEDVLRVAKDMVEEFQIDIGFTVNELIEHVDLNSIEQEISDDYDDDDESYNSENSNSLSSTVEFDEIDDLFEKQ